MVEHPEGFHEEGLSFFLSSFVCGSFSAVDFLISTSGPPTSPVSAWTEVQALVAHQPVADARAYRSGTKRLSRLAKQLTQRYVTPLPTALRATVVALIGLWAAEWADRPPSTPRGHMRALDEFLFSFEQPGGRAEKLLFAMTLLGGTSRGPRTQCSTHCLVLCHWPADPEKSASHPSRA